MTERLILKHTDGSERALKHAFLGFRGRTGSAIRDSALCLSAHRPGSSRSANRSHRLQVSVAD